MKIIVDEIVVDDIVVIVAVEDIVEDVGILAVAVGICTFDVWAHMTRCWWLQRPSPGSKRVPAGQRNRWVEPWASQR